MDQTQFDAILAAQIEQVGRKLLEELDDIRKQHGEDAYWQSIADGIAVLKAQGPRGEEAAREIFPDVDFSKLPPPTQPVIPEEVKYQPPPAPNEDMAKAIMAQIPGLENQAQFNVTMAAFDALRLLLSALFTGDKPGAERGQKALEGAVEAARQAAIITRKLRDVPEAVKGGSEFRQPPVETIEYDVMKALVTELEGIVTVDAFTEWYATNRRRLDDVKSQSLRNTLFDAIRERQGKLRGQSS